MVFGKDQSNKGKPHSEEHKKKISNSLIGKFKGKTYEEIMGTEKAKEMRILRKNKYLGKGNPFFNKKHDKKTKNIMSSLKLGKTHEEIMGKDNANKWHKRMSGKNHPFWKGGYSIKDYKNFTNLFKKAVRKRDNQICLMCGKHREKMNTSLSVHHIDYNKYNSIPQNCISLCFDCHAKTNFNRKYWISFFQNKLTDCYGYKYSDKGEIILKYV
jgi:hypothetical protein